MGQSFAFALDHVEKEFVRIQLSDPSNSLSTSRTSPPLCTANDAEGHEEELYAQHSRLATHITYPMLRRIVLPESIRVNTAHIAVLYCLDANHDGVFSIDDLTGFVKWVFKDVAVDVLAEEFAETVQAQATLRMWKECRHYAESRSAVNSSGQLETKSINESSEDETPAAAAEYFVDWMMRFMDRNFPTTSCSALDVSSTPTTSRTPPPSNNLPGAVHEDGFPVSLTLPPPPPDFPASPSPVVETLGADAIECLYILLNVRDGYGMTLQQFCRVLLVSSSSTSMTPAHEKHHHHQLQHVLVRKSSLPPLLMSFIRSYWRILSRLGLGVLL